MFCIIFFYFFLSAIRADEIIVTSTESGDVCDLDNSCNSTEPTETQTVKVNLTDKWKYNITDGISTNDTIIDIFHFNDTNATVWESRTGNRSEVTKENKASNTKYQVHFDDGCSCDITRGSCDMNCCCDRDCLNVNRDVFKNCMEDTGKQEDKYCPTKILNSPLLCVVKDNLYSRHFYPQHQIAEEVSNVDKLLRNRELFSWPFPSIPPEEEEIAQKFEQYEIASPIWIRKGENHTKPFRLPKSTIVSRDCSNKETMKYLEDFEEVCTHRLSSISASECQGNSSIFNAANYFENFSFVENPTLINSTQNCSQNCINITSFVCENDDLFLCVKINSTAKLIASFSAKTNICSNAVTSIHYAIFHNGTEGISSVHLYLQLTDIPFRENLLWALSFKLTFHWAHQNNAFKLSGYPGYEMGHPIITGYKMYQSLKDNKTSETLEMSFNQKDWLTVFRTKNDGSCWRTHRENVNFQENLYAHCFLDVPQIKTVENCELFQNEIFNTMFGAYINLSNVYISTLGDPNIGDKKKWAPILVDFPTNVLNETCYGIVTAVKMVILHSIVGEHDNPQRIIMGAKMTGNFFQRNVVRYRKVRVSFAVNFYDVTNPPLRIFAEPPTYEVKLPTDFFYPFFSSAVVPTVSPVLSVLALGFYSLR